MSTYEALKYSFSGANITALNGDNVASGTVASARIADLATSKITSGTFADARISSGSVTQHVSAVTNTSGTWTPTLYTASANFGASVTSSTARYVRVGDLVFCSAVFQISNGGDTGGDSTDTVYMGGLPITSANVSTPGQGFMRFRRGTIMLLVSQGNTTATLVYGSTQGGDPYSTSGDQTKRGNINEGFQTSKGYFSTGFLYRV